MTIEQDFYLDPNILLWVLLPITLTMVLVGVLRHYLTQLLDSPPKPQPLKAVREQRAITRGVLLRTHGHHLPAYEFKARRDQLTEAYDSGFYLKDAPLSADDGSASAAPAAPANPLDLANVEGMMGGVKKQMLMIVPQTVLMGWINYFFTGFILIRLPFPLTPRFKQMLQARIETQDMDVTWVSSISWYIINLFGLGSVYRLILGEENAADGTNDIQAMNAVGGAIAGGGMGPQPDFKKLYGAEKENLQLITHDWVCDGVEDRVLKLYDAL